MKPTVYVDVPKKHRDRARMLDLASRHASFEEKAPSDIVAEAVDLITGFIETK